MASLKAKFSDEALGLARIGFVLDKIVAPSDDAVEGSTFFCVIGAGPKARPNGDFVVFRNRSLEPIQLVARTLRREVIPMYTGPDASFGVVEQVRVTTSLLEAKLDN